MPACRYHTHKSNTQHTSTLKYLAKSTPAWRKHHCPPMARNTGSSWLDQALRSSQPELQEEMSLCVLAIGHIYSRFLETLGNKLRICHTSDTWYQYPVQKTYKPRQEIARVWTAGSGSLLPKFTPFLSPGGLDPHSGPGCLLPSHLTTGKVLPSGDTQVFPQGCSVDR